MIYILIYLASLALVLHASVRYRKALFLNHYKNRNRTVFTLRDYLVDIDHDDVALHLFGAIIPLINTLVACGILGWRAGAWVSRTKVVQKIADIKL